MRRHPTQSGLPGPSNLRGAPGNAYDAGGTHNLGIYGERAPHGNPFEAQVPAGGPVYRDSRALGHGPPPTTPKRRSVSFNTPKGASSLQGRNAAFLRLNAIDPTMERTT
ncbi:hypothetical protein R3P38DRAFT_3184728 [Favolaschia claudopus]|uniref:Uncharacterized protein n=1 Tax=Favolaschia claudopus TaxID=2862362 RepID=A0AAW0C9K6_9AGAR